MHYSKHSNIGSLASQMSGLEMPHVAYILGNDVMAYIGADGTILFRDHQGMPVDDFANVNEYVNLGLPSGRLWATCNVGADSPEGYGLLFPWASTVGYNGPEDHTFDYTTGNTPYISGTGSTISKINKYNTGGQGMAGNIDHLTELTLDDDAARINMGGLWRMPSYSDIDELFAGTTQEWTARNDINGCLFTSRTNGRELFFPASGGGYGSSLNSRGSSIYIWSRSLFQDDPGRAYVLLCTKHENTIFDMERCQGLSVRGVL